MWDYPRPPRIEPSTDHVAVHAAGVTVADSRRTYRVLETSQAPAYYVPPADVRQELLVPTAATSYCEWKGVAQYLDVVIDGRRIEGAAWRYREPTPPFRALVDHVAFYPGRLECTVDDELVRPMPGGFYGGWITGRVVGPFKGAPGTLHW